ncbi:prevent-host-death protein [Chryseobacterium oranimense]|uniref:prevent-host-death protein n=1 Tax=Chryseobacterium oranimense TaxID=421058 RepID=UPI0021AEA935|nr:prevent-host-death protein [Chryseobacterium oranimense]UWX60852.1 prevent-host-death protein [Chryseobacterium oranimense]
MKYTLELNTQEPGSNIVFNTIIFDTFKINIIEKYVGKMYSNPKLCEAIFKVRTLDDSIITARNGNSRIKIKGDQFQVYHTLTRVLNSYHYKNKLLNRNEADQDYVHFILKMVIHNYELN